jgi:hypothetical protein
MADPPSSKPPDLFVPRRLDADVRDDMQEVFVTARRTAAGESPDNKPGERRIVIVTPGRTIVSLPVKLKDQLSPQALAATQKWLGSEIRNITVIAYTRLDALMGGQANLSAEALQACIPFSPQLFTMASAGHNVVIFEGHEAAMEYALRDADVLIVDSGMLPFLQGDWLKIAKQVMHTGSAQCIYRREKKDVREVTLAAKGWTYREPDGEASYANCLLTILGKRSGGSVYLTTGQSVPDLRSFISDLDEKDWIDGLPFHYDKLDADAVIKTILRFAGVKNAGPRFVPGLKSHYALNARLAQEEGTSFCPFRLTLSGFGSKLRLKIL